MSEDYAPPLTVQDFTRVTGQAQLDSINRPSLTYWQDAWIRLKNNKQALFSLLLICLMLFLTCLGPWLWKADPAEQDVSRISEPPSIGKTVIVSADLTDFEPLVLADKPTAPAPGPLDAPAEFIWLGVPTAQSVRLQWSYVPGAAGYAIYRSQVRPSDSSSLGIPLGEVEAGNQLGFEDTFNIPTGTVYYSVVAKNGEESPKHRTLAIQIRPGISLSSARLIDPSAQPGQLVRLSPHPLGTDYLGRDLLARLMAGARVSLFIGFFAPLFSTLLGMLIGGFAGFFGGAIDAWLMRFTDFVLALPFFLFMILIKIAFGIGAGDSGVGVMLIALACLSWPGLARLIRGQTLQLRESDFVQASKLLGAGPVTLIARHLLPNTLAVVLVSLTFAIPSAIFTEAFLSFIGMGVVPPTPSWGSMTNDGIQTFLNTPHEFIFPALAISVTVLAFNLLGDGLRDALDPRMRGRS